MKEAERRKVARPPARLILGTPIHFLAFGFGAGLSPLAPGTVGTLVGLPFWFLLDRLPVEWYCGALVALFLFGVHVCGESARLLQVHDYPGLVFDEIVGFLIACLPLLPALNDSALPMWAGLILAFVLFRFFDVLKPWPIRILDRHVGGGFGVMLDDACAGLAAAAVLWGVVALL